MPCLTRAGQSSVVRTGCVHPDATRAFNARFGARYPEALPLD